SSRWLRSNPKSKIGAPSGPPKWIGISGDPPATPRLLRAQVALDAPQHKDARIAGDRALPVRAGHLRPAGRAARHVLWLQSGILQRLLLRHGPPGYHRHGP